MKLRKVGLRKVRLPLIRPYVLSYRTFHEFQPIPVEVRDVPSVTVMGDSHETLAVAGLRWSPDWFHRARGVTKVDTVWWSVLLSIGVWTAGTITRAAAGSAREPAGLGAGCVPHS